MELKNHPAADSFPMMDSKRFQELVQDIKTQGQLEPITLCEGMVLDGRNRYKACLALGVEPITRTFEGDPWARAWSLNGERRDLVDEQRYLIWKFCNENSETWQTAKQAIMDAANRKRSEAADARRDESGKLSKAFKCEKCGGNIYVGNEREHRCQKPVVGHNVLPQVKTEPGKTAKAAASKTNAGAVARGDKLAKERPDLAQKVMRGEMRPADAHKEVRKDRQKNRMEQAAKKHDAKSATWQITDKQDIIKCDALITDPPYGILTEKWEPGEGGIEDVTRLWATRWGDCGADIILVFFSQRFLWQGRQWFDESFLDYEFQQLLVWHYPNNKKPQSRQMFKQTWEPIFFYRKKGCERQIRNSGDTWGKDLNEFDCHVSAVPQSNFNDAECKVHPAQKPVSVFRWLINAVTEPGELVCDPFAGSGTSGIAATQLKRRWHGVELEPEYIKQAKERIAAYGNAV